MKKEKLQRIILAAIIMFGICYAYSKFLLLPHWEVIQNNNQRLKSLQNQYQELLNYQKDRTSLQKDIIMLENRVLQLKKQLPSRLDKPELMVELYTLAKQHGVNPQSISFDQSQNKGLYQEMGISLSCLGKTTDLLSFIHDLQFGRGQRMGIKSINLAGSQGNMRVDLKLTATILNGFSNNSSEKQSFMNSSIGVDSPEKMFHP
ncbi:type 4a pilus biogenesis protein PilO [Desulfosporosinus sp. SYSU MS00001]|uniref:type 4a pilus biogenesis protein PilO n=1 Tax=Desulfosporosinus sp. SYSU MS00001 TaxID=3416284 RepID=UPI003CF0A69A